MSINIPNKDQWGKMNMYLSAIAGALGSQIDVSTWEGVQKAVRSGLAPELFPIGTQLIANHSKYGEILFDVVAHDYLKDPYNENAHTMTLLSHHVLDELQFDATEAFYYAESELPAGRYTFTIPDGSGVRLSSGTFQFTLPVALPKGGQLCIDDYYSGYTEDHNVLRYASRTDTTPMGASEIDIGNDGTNLGTFGVELNNTLRLEYGSNNYKESAIRQFLNSSSAAGSVWTPQTKFDRPPAWMSTLDGFARGLDSDFLYAVGEVIVPCSANSVYESPDSTVVKNTKYTLKDKFYLASRDEIFEVVTSSDSDIVADDSVLFPYYEGAMKADRSKVKKETGETFGWWSRSAISFVPYDAFHVSHNGGETRERVSNNMGLVPACTIV